uniref:Adaptor related protein complex 1 subunit beta 1 n=1 Tax=Equus asinus TaxID=9793 RepID=A0A9L0I5M4_EQUAS
MTDSKYFTTTKKGEIFELKAELNSDKKEKKKEAVKKVIASMTVGKDVRPVQTEGFVCRGLMSSMLMGSSSNGVSEVN